MKRTINLSNLQGLLLCVGLLLTSGVATAAKPQKKVENKTLHVDGEIEGEADQELNYLKGELNNVRGLRRGYKKKAKVYTKLTEESEQLKENFSDYIEHRVEYEAAIQGYNKTIECLKNGDALKCAPDAGKKKKKKVLKRKPVYRDYDSQDEVSFKEAAPKRTRAVSGTSQFIRDVDSRISQRGQDLLRCYRKGGYSQQGVLKVQLKIAPNGNLDHLGLEDTTQINNPKVVSCLSQVLYSIVYPPTPSQKVTTVRKPFVFNLM